MTINLSATLVVSETPVTYSKKGEKLPIGDLALRLHLSCFDKNEDEINPKKSENRFDINCFNIQPWELEYIPVEVENRQYYLDLVECSERLHLSKKKIRSYLKQNNFFNLLGDNISKLNRLSSVVNHYERLMRYYNQNSNKIYLFSKKGVMTPLVTKKGLMKIVHIVEKELEKKDRPTIFKLRLEKDKLKKVELNYISKIVVYSSSKNDCIIINHSSKTRVMQGASSIVFKVHNLSIANFSILKKSIVAENSESLEEIEDSFKYIKNEVAVLKILGAHKTLKGIQSAPYFSYQRYKQSKWVSNLFPRMYYYGHFYNQRDLLECSDRLSIEERVNELAQSFNQIITGLYLLHKKKFFHTDIKPENIFVELNNKKKYNLCIADMAGVRRTTKDDKLFKIDLHTRAYTPLPPDGSYTRSQLQALDVFQMGATLVTTLVDKTPYCEELSSNEYPNPQIPFDDSVLNQYCSKEAVDLLREMCLLDEKLRPNIAEVRQRVKAFGFSWKKEVKPVNTDSTGK